MSNRSGKLLSAILVSSLAGSVLTLASHDSAHADDNCLSAPKNATPAGSHWYFHVERGTKRHCWYLGDARGKTAQTGTVTASAKPSQPAAAPAPTSPKTTAPLQPEVANARAEFNGTSSGNDQPTTDATTPAADATSTNAIQNPSLMTSDSSPSTVTSRWPDPSSNTPQTQPQPTPAAVLKPPSQPASQLLGERTEPGPVVPRVASMPSLEKPTYSMPMLLGGLGGALALAGILGFAAVKFGSWGGLSRPRRRQGSIWDVADAVQPPPWESGNAEPAMPPRGSDHLRTRQEIEMQSRDILEILSRASRNATT